MPVCYPPLLEKCIYALRVCKRGWLLSTLGCWTGIATEVWARPGGQENQRDGGGQDGTGTGLGKMEVRMGMSTGSAVASSNRTFWCQRAAKKHIWHRGWLLGCQFPK